MLISGKLFFSSLQQLYRDREGEKEDYIYEDDVPSVEGRQMNTYKFESDKKEAEMKPKRMKKELYPFHKACMLC